MNYKQYVVLYVDDEPANLTTFSYCFEDQFRIVTAMDATEAMQKLASEPVALLLTDQRMPGVTGAQLCAMAREKYPDVVRMVVTAYADVADAVAAINSGQVARYILKPWREEAMLEVLRAGVEAYQLGTLVHDLQLRLLKSEQQSTTNFLIGRVIHELSNPASSVSTNVRWMSDAMHRMRQLVPATEARGGHELGQMMDSFQEALDDAVEGCRELATRLTRFREGQQAPRPSLPAGVDLARNVDAAVAIVRGLVRPRARLLVEHGLAPPVAIDRTHLSQVLVNLLMNAAEAIEPGSAEDNRILIRTYADATHGYVEVDDTGRGISPIELERVFEPYYTSKSASGHGLGLSVVRELVEIAAGRIDVDSEVGRGTKFTVKLPLVP